MAAWFHADQECTSPEGGAGTEGSQVPVVPPPQGPQTRGLGILQPLLEEAALACGRGWQGTGEAGEPARARDGLVPGRWEAIRWPSVRSHRRSGGHEGGTQVPEPSLAPSAPGVCGHGRAVLISRPGARTSSPHLHRKHPSPLTNAFSGQAESPGAA